MSDEGVRRQADVITKPVVLGPGGRRVLLAGTTLLNGRFSVVQRIGEGGMGVVYEAFDTERNALVALKTLNRLDPGSVYRLKNEFRALADVSHPNLVRLHELFSDGGHWFFTMERVAGESFDSWVRPSAPSNEGSAGETRLEEGRLRAALPQLCAGIAAIHAAGKLQRDLKPSNVLVTNEGRVVVLDFGLAADPELGGVGQTVLEEGFTGTPAYVAPEQAASKQATAASDYYSLGVMLFEALTGRLPFTGSVLEMLVDKQRGAAPAAAQSSPNVPPDLNALCEELLRREPSERPSVTTLQGLLGMKPASRALPGSAGPMPKGELLLGRDREIAQLRSAYEAMGAGQAVVLFVSGESGIGKSALLTHFLDELRAEGHAAVLAGRCYERESVPFKGIDSLVDDLSRFLRKVPREDAFAMMPREAYALARLFPVLGRIDAVAESPTKAIVDPQELRQRAFAAFGELLARIRDRRPLVLHIDDVQWLDRDAVTFLGHFLAQHDPAAALFILSHRSDVEGVSHSLVAQLNQYVRNNPRINRRELPLTILLPEAAQILAVRLLRSGHGDATRATEIALESGGSPFLLQELARQAQRSTGGRLLTLQDALVTHVEALSAGARHLLEVLAVAGRPLSVALALKASGARHEDVDTLNGERLLRSGGNDAARTLECYHDKIRESVAQTLSAERTRDAHASLLAALAAQKGSDAEHLALHAQGAGDGQATLHYTTQAAAAASEAMAFERAASLYNRALELGEHAEDERRALRVKMGEALSNAGRGADAARAYVDAAEGAAEDHAQDLKRSAAEQMLISGQIDAGKALLGEVLQTVGLDLPRSPKMAMLLLLRERLRLKLRGLSFRERKDDLPSAQRRELDILWSAVRGLIGVDLFTGAALTSRFARLALDSGIPEHAARALGAEAAVLASSSGGPGAKARCRVLLDRAEALAITSASSEALGWVHVSRLSVAYWQLASDVNVYFEQAVSTLRERCTGVAFELCHASFYRQLSSNNLGDFAPVVDLAALIDDAWRRGDLYTALQLTYSSAWSRLIRDDADGVRRHLDQARRQWRQPRDCTFLDLDLVLTEAWHGFYSGEYRRGLERAKADWPAIERAQLLRAPFVQALLRGMRGSCALGVARLGGADSSARVRLRVLRLAPSRVSVYHLRPR